MKRKKIYTKLLKLGSNYGGELHSVTINYINQDSQTLFMNILINPGYDLEVRQIKRKK